METNAILAISGVLAVLILLSGVLITGVMLTRIQHRLGRILQGINTLNTSLTDSNGFLKAMLDVWEEEEYDNSLEYPYPGASETDAFDSEQYAFAHHEDPVEQPEGHTSYREHIRNNKILTPGKERYATVKHDAPIRYVVRHSSEGEVCYAVITNVIREEKEFGEIKNRRLQLRVLSEEQHSSDCVRGVKGKPYLEFADGSSQLVQKRIEKGLTPAEAFIDSGIL